MVYIKSMICEPFFCEDYLTGCCGEISGPAVLDIQVVDMQRLPYKFLWESNRVSFTHCL